MLKVARSLDRIKESFQARFWQDTGQSTGTGWTSQASFLADLNAYSPEPFVIDPGASYEIGHGANESREAVCACEIFLVFGWVHVSSAGKEDLSFVFCPLCEIGRSSCWNSEMR